MSINCILLGDYSLRDTFVVNVCDINPIGTAQVKYDELKIEDLKYLIWDKKKATFGDFNSGRINLWKVNIAFSDIAKLKGVTEEQIKDNDNDNLNIFFRTNKQLTSKPITPPSELILDNLVNN